MLSCSMDTGRRALKPGKERKQPPMEEKQQSWYDIGSQYWMGAAERSRGVGNSSNVVSLRAIGTRKCVGPYVIGEMVGFCCTISEVALFCPCREVLVSSQ
jgi:hypothetical protein